MTINEAMQLAVQYHQAGRLAEAEGLYREVLAQQPDHAEALHLLGVLAGGAGNMAMAVELIGRAISINPVAAEYHADLGECYRRIGKLDEAITTLRLAIGMDPNHANAHNNLGNALFERGLPNEAIVAYRRAIQLRPEHAQAHYNLANALRDIGQGDEAIVCYRRALVLRPDYPEAHNNLGNVWRDAGRLDEAIACYRRALAYHPDFLQAHNNLGVALRDNGQLDEAIAACQRAIALDPSFAEAYVNLGNALERRGRLDEAIAAHRQAIALRPNFSEAHNNLGNVLKDQGQLDEAIATYGQALAIDPENACLDSNRIYVLHFRPDFDARVIFRETNAWNSKYAASLTQYMQPHDKDCSPERRLRVGYVSPDFRAHSVASFLESLLANHDTDQVEVFCYADLRLADEVTARLRRHAHHWLEITGQSDEQVAERIRASQIDILVDLAGHTGGNRLLVFARKPAPVQVTYLGYPDTTGLTTIDYRLTDASADPPGNERFYSEKLLRLPRCFLCFCPPESSPEVSPLPSLTRQAITFGSFNALPKINQDVAALWSRVLQAVPNSRILIKSRGLSEISTRDRVLSLFAAHGITSDRLDLRPSIAARNGHLSLYNEIDIGLDPFPYNGTTTTCEALWMGTPVITLAGRSHAGRVGFSLLTSLGLAELAAQTMEDYVQLAAELAGDLPRLSALRSTLRDRMRGSPLTDGRGFARDVEAAYRQMWRQWCGTR